MSDASRDQSARRAVVESRRNAWAIMFAGLVLGMVGMHLTAIRPLKQQMEQMNRELTGVQGDLSRMSSLSRLADQTNGLRDSLASQRRQIEEARAAAESVRRLCASIEEESRMSKDALAALSDFSTLQEMLISNRDRVAAAAHALEDISSLHKKLANIKAAVNQDAYNVDLAASRVDELLNLKDQIIWRGANTSSARNTVDGLLMLRDGLASESVDVAAAGENLERLLTMEAKLARRQISLNDEQSIEAPPSLFEGLRLDDPLPGAARLAGIALRTSTAGRAYRGFEPLMLHAGIGAPDERQLRIMSLKMLAKRPTRISRLEGPANEFGPGERMDMRRELRPNTRTLTAPVPWPFEE